MKSHGLKYILVGFLLVLFGAVAPFMMVLGVIASSFWLSILTYGASIIGLLLGVVGATTITEEKLDK